MNFLIKITFAILMGCSLQAFANNAQHDHERDKDRHHQGNHHQEKNQGTDVSSNYYNDLFLSKHDLLVANTGDVNVTFLYKEAAYLNDLFLTGNPNKILNNQTATIDQVFSLGSFQAGAKIAFDMFVNNTGNTYFTGSPALNPDQQLHAIFSFINEDTIKIGFEDIFGGGDRDYDDLVFKVSNVTLGHSAVQPVPEPQTYLLMLLGLLLVAQASRRRQIKR